MERLCRAEKSADEVKPGGAACRIGTGKKKEKPDDSQCL
jgi:hypothetical protein